MSPSFIRILVADDHPVVRSGLAMILAQEADMSVVGEAADGRAAVALYLQHRPDVLVLDLGLPDVDGWQVLERVRAADPSAKVLVVSTFGGDDDVHRALRAGALGYLLKESTADQITAAVRDVAQGVQRVSGSAALALAHRVQFEELTPRELDIVRLMARGQSNREIGQKLGLTENTVKGYVTNVLAKLGVDDRTAAVAIARDRGLLRR